MFRNLRHPLRTEPAMFHSRAAPGSALVPTPRVMARSWPLDRWCLTRLARWLAGVPVTLRLWDGTEADAANPVVATVRISDRRTLLQLLVDPDVGFGEAYRDGRITVTGDLLALLVSIDTRIDWRHAGGVSRMARARLGGSIARAQRNIHHHYDLGNEFYKLWLDRELVYTCAYFPAADTDLDAAQQAKMEYVCRKAAIRPGDVVFEAGCGWGALALYAARRYGATVRAWNLSAEQVSHARERARAEGLADRVEFVLDDYRRIDGACDVFLSIGMLEHVGPSHYRELGDVMNRCLRPSGRGVLHFIGRNAPAAFSAWVGKRIFPGAYAPTLTEAIGGVLEPFRFSVLDVENLRLHYARTLAHWLSRFDTSAGSVERMFGERFVRTWRLYLAGSQASFETGCLQLFQIIFARETDNELRWTRAGLYA